MPLSIKTTANRIRISQSLAGSTPAQKTGSKVSSIIRRQKQRGLFISSLKKSISGADTSPKQDRTLKGYIEASMALKRFRGERAMALGLLTQKQSDGESERAQSEQKTVSSRPSMSLKRFKGERAMAMGLLTQRPSRTAKGADDGQADSAAKTATNLASMRGVTKAVTLFRTMADNADLMEDDDEHGKELKRRAKVLARRQADGDEAAQASLAEAERALMMNPPKSLAIVMAAKRGDWLTVEKELKACKKGEPRINATVPRTGETALMFACQQSNFLFVGQLCEMGSLLSMRSQDQRTVLHYAAETGNDEIVKILLRNRADPNLFGGDLSQLPIHIAASRVADGSLVSAQWLLRASLKESRLLKDGLGNLPIAYAVESGSLPLVREMLAFFPKEQVRWRHDQTGEYLVHLAARKKSIEIMSTLGRERANINVQNNDGQTPLHISAKLGDEAMVRLLKTFDAKPDIQDKKERAPIHLAAEYGHAWIVEFLAERFKANINLRTKDGSTLLHVAAERGYEEVVLALIKRGVPLNMPNKSGALCLHAAAHNAHVSIIKTLIKKGSDVDARTKDGYTALHLAVLNCKPEVIQVLLGFGAKVDLKGGPLKEAPLHIAARLPDGYSCAEMVLKSGAMVNNTTEETLDTPLHIAAKTGATELLKLLLEEGADPMRLNRTGETCLHMAVRSCWYECVKAIISFINYNSSRNREAANLVNLANYEGETCFHLAAELGTSQAHNPFEDVDIIRLLLENGADPLAGTRLTNEMALHYNARSGNPDILVEIVRHLGGEFQFACNRQDRFGWSPLVTACEQGHASFTEILLANGARADVFDEYGKAGLHLGKLIKGKIKGKCREVIPFTGFAAERLFPLIFAAENGHTACCEILLNYKAFVNAKSKIGLSPLHFAAQSGFADLVKLLIKKYRATVNILSLSKKTPLHLAASAGRKDVCLALINLRADTNAVDALGQTPLHFAAENNHADVVKLFIKHKPELITAVSKTGMTCAHIAASNGAEAVIKLLMQYNKELVTSVRNKFTEALPLHLAVNASHEHVVRLLIDAGASPLAENQEGMTAIHMAAQAGDMEVTLAIIASSPVQALGRNSLKNGLSPLHVAAFYGKTDIVRELQTRVDVNSKTDQPRMAHVVNDPELKAVIVNDYGLTPLHLASLRGHVNVVRLLLNNSSLETDVPTDLLARVPLHYASQNGHTVVVSLLMSRSNAHLKLQDKQGRFPLHLAAENGHLAMVSMLLGQGVQVDCTDQNSWTPLHYAAQNGFFDVVKLLSDSGASPTVKTIKGKVPLGLCLNGGHLEIMHYLLNKDHDTEELIADRSFLMDLMLCSKASDDDALDEFVMHSKAPLYTAAKLTKLYRDLASKEMERAKDLNELSRHCQRMSADLLGIASTIASPAVILRATDSKGKQMLDMFLENEMKDVIEHASVQRYLSDVWAGTLGKWSSSRLFLLSLTFVLFPPVLAYFVLPFSHHSFHRIPVIKFIAMIVSHIYFIAILTFAAAVPFHPIVDRDDFYPFWYEYILLAFISGLLVSQLLKPSAETGLGMFRYVIILSAVLAVWFHISAILAHVIFESHPTARNLMYMRNFMLSLTLLFATLLILDFLLIHHLFGPFGVIITRVLRDTIASTVVLLIFLVAFSFMICCLYTPTKRPSNDNISSNISNVSDSTEALIMTQIDPNSTDFFNETDLGDGNSTNSLMTMLMGMNSTVADFSQLFDNSSNLTDLGDGNSTNSLMTMLMRMNSTVADFRQLFDNSSNLTDMFFEEFSTSNYSVSQLIRQKCQPKKPNITVQSRSCGQDGSIYDCAGRQVTDQGSNPTANNLDPLTVTLLFDVLYFAMHGMVDFGSVPLVQDGPGWANQLFIIYLGAWLTVSAMILLPLLIAILTDSYKIIQMRSDSEWKFGRAKLIRDMIQMPAAPTPLNLLVRAYLYFASLRRHGRRMFTIYANYYAAEDEHEGDEEVLHDVGDVHHGAVQLIELVLDWSKVVRRYNANIKNDLSAIQADNELLGKRPEDAEPAEDKDQADPPQPAQTSENNS